MSKLSKEIISTIETTVDSSNDMTVVIFESFVNEVDYEDNQLCCNDGDTIAFDGCEDSDVRFFLMEELEMEDDIFDFIKDYKKSLKSVSNFNAKKLHLFVENECNWITSEEALEEYQSIQHLEENFHNLSFFLLTEQKICH